MKLSAGTRVTVRQDLNIYNYGEYRCDVSYDMLDFAGKTLTIRKVIVENGNVYYKTYENDFYWTEPMFVKQKEFSKHDLSSGMIIELRNGEKGILFDDRIICIKNCYRLAGFANDLENYTDTALDIVRVYKSTNTITLGQLFNADNLLPVWEKDIWYNGKIICINNCGSPSWTTGKIYEFVDGIVKTDDGVPSPRIRSIQNFMSIVTGEWLEIKD